MERLKIRKPTVAGQFYPLTEEAIRNQIRSFIKKDAVKSDFIGCLLPHAGYKYSGEVAVATVSQINIKSTVILLGPNHTGYGAPFSIMVDGAWQTPLGDVKIDAELAKLFLERCPYLKNDALAHRYEHSLEVELPILQYFNPDFQMVPIAFMTDDTAALKKTGEAIAACIKETGRQGSTLIVASSDMTHYESEASAEKKDKEAIQAMLELDEDKLMKKIASLAISMCGRAPAVAMLSAAKHLGATHARLIQYQTSGAVTQDRQSVVGYAGIVVY